MTSLSAPRTVAPTGTATSGTGPRTAALAAVLIVSAALPFIFLPMEQSWGHLAFHLVGAPVCVVAIILLAGIRRISTSKAVRVLTWIPTVTFAGWCIGHLGEMAVVLSHGGAHADEHVFEHPVHSFFATIAIPSWLGSVVTTLVLLVTIGILALVRARARARARR